MKFAILGDTHWGARNDSPVFYKHFEKFYDQFFDHLAKEGIKLVIQLGDTFEARKKTNSLTLSEARRIYFDRAQKLGIHTYITVGNHDIYFRESVSVNAPRLTLGEYSTVHVVDKPQLLNLGYWRGALDGEGPCIDLIPWICQENEAEIVDFIKKSESTLCCGHFEIAGFAMYRGGKENDGLSMDLFDRYDHVWSGHYHTKSRKENITYVGTPYETTWEDFKDPKGYHIYDTETGEITFFENQNKTFFKLTYDDTETMVVPTGLTDCIVKVVVVNNSSQLALESYLQGIRDQGPHDLNVDEKGLTITDVNDDNGVVIEDTMAVTEKYIDASETKVDKDALKKFMYSLYVEAINMEAV